MSKQEEIKQALAAATPGPWRLEIDEDEHGLVGVWADVQGRPGVSVTVCEFDSEIFVSEADADLIAKAPEYIAYLVETLEEVLLDRDIAKQNSKQWEKCYDAAEEKSDQLRKELEEKEILLSGRQYTINRLKEQNEEIASMGIRDGEQISRLLQLEKKQAKELEEAIKILRFYSQQEHYIDEDPGLYASPAICQDSGSWARSFLVGQEGR